MAEQERNGDKTPEMEFKNWRKVRTETKKKIKTSKQEQEQEPIGKILLILTVRKQVESIKCDWVNQQ